MRFDKRPAKKSKTGYTWRVSFDYTDRYGKKRKYSKSGFATKKAAEVHGREVLNDLQNGLNIREKDTTVDEIFQQWKAGSHLAENTIHIYTNRYEKHIRPVFGSVPLANIHYFEVQSFINTVSGKGYSLVQQILVVLKHIYEYGMKTGITNENPAAIIKNNGRMTVNNRQEYLDYLDFQNLKQRVYSKHEPFDGTAQTILLDLGYYAGLRLAEICALRWEDVDMDSGVITVRQQLSYTGRQMADFKVSTKLKTQTSGTPIPIPSVLKDTLKSWREDNPYSLIVCKEDGTFINPQTTRQSIRKIAKDMGIDFHPHMLRHTYITNLIMSGADPKTASELARHSSPTMTLGIYTEVNNQMKTDILEKAFSETPDILA
ncbi:site-specific integrase [Faecalibaculum rodentium]|uniref:site-specific integrase n=1 Tax=Faecalibaculum rodentium TaxID=1702221 RepID=UPI0023F464F6|nr:site-specific integrase [Faecalibaculum rodentium]